MSATILLKLFFSVQELVPGSHLRFRTQFEDDVLCSGSRLYGFGGAEPSDGKPSSHAPIPTAKVIRLRPGEALIRNGARQRKPGQIVFSWPLVQVARVHSHALPELRV